jgi:glycerol uptake facilitator-like aquaporin
VQRFLAELLGTFLVVLFHGGASASLRIIAGSAQAAPSPQSIAFLALIDGFSLFMIIMIIGKISGVLINPAVTIGLATRRRFPRNEVPIYIVAQFAGAPLGAAAILPTIGRDALTIGHLGAVQLAPGVSIWQGMLVEALGAFVLVLTISATAEDPRSPSGWAAFAIGMALFAIVMLRSTRREPLALTCSMPCWVFRSSGVITRCAISLPPLSAHPSPQRSIAIWRISPTRSLTRSQTEREVSAY